MPGRICSVSGYRRENLTSGWAIAAAAPDPDGESGPKIARSLTWIPLSSLCTVGHALRSSPGDENLRATLRIDSRDWWYRLRFFADRCDSTPTILGLEGLAGTADVWLNGQAVLSSDNMFLAHEVAVDELLSGDNELVLRFRSLDTILSKKRPRPRWRTPMVEHQQLRWIRGSLLGRTPGWSPPVPAVGPWRPVWLETRPNVQISDLTLNARTSAGEGVLEVACNLVLADSFEIDRVEIVLTRDVHEFRASLRCERQSDKYSARLSVPNVSLWWPHTHGEPALYKASLQICNRDAGIESVIVDLGKVGFKEIAIQSKAGDFEIQINGLPIFCRGACWTPLDCVSLQSASDDYVAAVSQVKDAGMNMLRVSGTMVYEEDAFYDACDSLGVLLWQDFMFANMDYPEGDHAFDDSVKRESEQLLHRLSGRACLAVLCGGSEVEQQAAMSGAPRQHWHQKLFHEVLLQRSRQIIPHMPYWPSSAHGGSFPHQASEGTTSYYGVGAYLRPLTDARRSQVRFATECLAFANVPEDESLDKMAGGVNLKIHSPEWKQRVPRDLGAGWDFDDVRDHYLFEIFGLRPLDIRYSDHARFLDLSRAVSGETMAAAFREWRRQGSGCRGALMWFLRDLWLGAGWGIIAADGTPKAPYYFLRRCLQPVSISLRDEGLNGIELDVCNERALPLRASLEVAIYREAEFLVTKARRPIELAAHSAEKLQVAEFFDGLMDLSRAFRFGPPSHDLIVATLHDDSGDVLSTHHLILSHERAILARDLGANARIHSTVDGEFELIISTQRFAYCVATSIDGFRAEDQYFNIAPDSEWRTRLRRTKPGAKPTGFVRALNSAKTIRIATA